MKIDYVTLLRFVDDFGRGWEPRYKKQLISDGRTKRNRRGHLSLAEIFTILKAYHQLGGTYFKYFYFHFFSLHQKLFPRGVHCSPFVKLIKRAFPDLVCLLKSLEEYLSKTLTHHRHRCPIIVFSHLFAGLISYQLRPDKPSLHSLTNIIP